MRLSPPLSVLGIVGVALVAASQIKERANIADSCNVLLAFMKAETRSLGSEFVVVNAPSGEPSNDRIDEVLVVHPEFRQHPYFPIYRQMANFHNLQPTEKCRNLAIWLKSKNVQVNHSELKNWQKFNLNKATYGISMPGISADDGTAILYYYAFNVVAGGFFEVRAIRQPNGSWTYEKLLLERSIPF